VDVLPWIGLIVFGVALLSGLVFAGVRGMAAWRTLRSFQRRLEAAMAETTRLLDGIEPRVAKASATAVRLEQARARLEESVATAKVLFDAFGEATALIRRVAAFVPR
jgi:hypothetical protein